MGDGGAGCEGVSVGQADGNVLKALESTHDCRDGDAGGGVQVAGQGQCGEQWGDLTSGDPLQRFYGFNGAPLICPSFFSHFSSSLYQRSAFSQMSFFIFSDAPSVMRPRYWKRQAHLIHSNFCAEHRTRT